MPSLESAATLVSATSTAPSTTTTAAAATTSTAYVYSYATSKIVRTAVAAGVIVLSLAAIVMFSKISSWVRQRQRFRRQRLLTLSLQSEQQANAYEIAAWAAEPTTARSGPGQRVNTRQEKSRKERREELRVWKRGGANAWALNEWEGIAA